MRAIRIHTVGGPEVLKYEEVPVPVPGKGEALVKVAACGVNYIDVYFRSGLSKESRMPFTPGREASGTVEKVGEGVTEVGTGDRVAWAIAPGSYAEYTVVPAARLVKLPDRVDFKLGAATLLQGLTAHYLTHSTFPLRPGHRAVVHAAAGGVGTLLTQLAKKRGATVYATVSNETKGEVARGAGADEIIIYTKQDFEEEIRRLSSGGGVDVVYDSVGKNTFEKSLNCLRPRGYMVLFGHSSGPVPPFDPGILNIKGSLFLTRPSLVHHTLTREELLGRANDLFGWIAEGQLKVRIDHVFPLRDAAKAHQALEGRQTTGKILLIP